VSLARMEQGNFSQVKGVGGGVFEYKLDFGPGYRGYVGKDGETLVILLRWGNEETAAERHRHGKVPLAGLQTKKKAGELTMPLTRSFKATIQTRVRSDPAFRDALLREGVESLLAGDVENGKAVLRDYINATIGFEELGVLADKSAKSLMRMFGPRGNPQAKNLFEVIGHLQKQEGVQLEVHAVR